MILQNIWVAGGVYSDTLENLKLPTRAIAATTPVRTRTRRSAKRPADAAYNAVAARHVQYMDAGDLEALKFGHMLSWHSFHSHVHIRVVRATSATEHMARVCDLLDALIGKVQWTMVALCNVVTY